jgi:hypothetical protein
MPYAYVHSVTESRVRIILAGPDRVLCTVLGYSALNLYLGQCVRASIGPECEEDSEEEANCADQKRDPTELLPCKYVHGTLELFLQPGVRSCHAPA